MKLKEIQRMPKEKPIDLGYQDDEEQSEKSQTSSIPPNIKKIAGAPNLGYITVGGSRDDYLTLFSGANLIIHLFDLKGRAQIGYLALRPSNFPLPNSAAVANVLIHPYYRGRGLGQSLYGVAVKELGMTIVSDDTQTPEARRMWVNLHNIPGVSVRGWINFSSSDVDPTNDLFGNAQYNLKRIARLQGLPKGQTPRPLGKSSKRGDFVYFDFPVQSGLGGTELQAAEKLAAIYTSYHPEDNRRDYDVGLYARWTG